MPDHKIDSLGPVPLESANISSSSASFLSLFLPFSFVAWGAATTAAGIAFGVDGSTTSTTLEPAPSPASTPLCSSLCAFFVLFFFLEAVVSDSLAFELELLPFAAVLFIDAPEAFSLPLIEAEAVVDDDGFAEVDLAGFEKIESISVTAAVDFSEAPFGLAAFVFALEDDA